MEQKTTLLPSKYEQKYRRLKRYIKSLVFENAALCDQVALVQENILRAEEERRFLLNKLLEHEPDLENLVNAATAEPRTNGIDPSPTPPSTAAASGATPAVAAVHQPRKYKKRSNSTIDQSPLSLPPAQKPRMTAPAISTPSTHHQPLRRSKTPTPTATAPTSTTPPKKQTISIPLDSSGHPIYPFSVSGFTVHNLGDIVVERPGYHTEQNIYPVGYRVTRTYGHFRDPERRCHYTCRVIDSGEFPRFEISADEGGGEQFRIAGPSPDYCHTTLLQYINNSTDIKNIDIRPQGEAFFGLGNLTIASLIQNFPNAKRLVNFKGMRLEGLASRENDPSLNFDALQRHINLSAYHTVPEIKDEPPPELF